MVYPCSGATAKWAISLASGERGVDTDCVMAPVDECSAPIPLLIIGAHKAGTTSLYAALAEHPQISGPDPKEPGFFSLQANPTEGQRSRYRRRGSRTGAGIRYWMDGSTSYGQTLKFPGVAQRIRTELGPDTRVIFMARDPLARISSGYLELRSEWARSVAAGIGDCIDELVEPTLYRAHIQTYEDIFGSDQVAVRSLEQLLARPSEVLAEIIAWLGLDPAPLQLPALNRAEQKSMPPTWADRRWIRQLRHFGGRLPSGPRRQLALAFNPMLRRLGTAPERVAVTWEDLGPWGARVRDEAVWCATRLGDDPRWPSLSVCELSRGGERPPAKVHA
jgi:hypothetical protein